MRQQLLQQLEDGRGTALEVTFDAPGEPIRIHGDAVMLKEALRNVLGNAIVHGARKKLAVCVAAVGERVEVTVSDDGPGIDPAQWQALRTPFTPRSDGRLGTSLGLAIVDEVMRAHRAELRFERPVEGGFRVVLSLPRAAGAPPPSR